MKPEQTKLAALSCAALALGFAFWNRTDKDKDGETTIIGNPIDQTKLYPRGETDRKMRTKNPREQFDAARKRGLTEHEIRSILNEYLAATTYEDQPNRPIEAIMKEIRLKRWNIYLDTLAETMNLTEQQITEAQKKLPSLAAMDSMRSLLLESVDRAWDNSIKTGTHDSIRTDDPNQMTRSEKIEIMLTYPLYYKVEGTRPWDLCELSESQKEMLGFKNDAGEWTWVDGERTLDFGTTENYADLENPFAVHGNIMATAGKVFPLSMWQVERLGEFEDESVSPHTPISKTGGSLDRVKFLTKPQLKTLLLLRPETAKELTNELGE